MGEKLSKQVFVAVRFGGDENPLPYKAIRVMLAEKFGVLPVAIDKMSYSELVEVISVVDGEGKAQKAHTKGR